MANRVFAIQDLEEIYDFADAGRDVHREKLSALQDEVQLWFYDAAQDLENSYCCDYARYSGQDNPFLTYKNATPWKTSWTTPSILTDADAVLVTVTTKLSQSR